MVLLLVVVVQVENLNLKKTNMDEIKEVKGMGGRSDFYIKDKWIASIVVTDGEVYLDKISNTNFVKYILLGED